MVCSVLCFVLLCTVHGCELISIYLLTTIRFSRSLPLFHASNIDDEFGEKTVSILLDGEESEMIFIDHPSSEMSVSNQSMHTKYHHQYTMGYTGYSSNVETICGSSFVRPHFTSA